MMFLAVALASLLDPVSWLGYLLAGLLMRRLHWALLAAIVWRSALFAMTSGTSARVDILLAVLCGAAAATSGVFMLAKFFRRPPRSVLRKTAVRVDPTSGD